MSRLRTYVTVRGVTYGPDSEVPADVAARITNPKAWDGPAPAAAGDSVAAGTEPAAGKPAGRRHAPSRTAGSK